MKEFGLAGDAHGGPWHRQLSLLAIESIKKMQDLGLKVHPGSFAENITTEGLVLPELPIGTRLALGLEAEVEVTLEEAASGTTRLVEVDGRRLDVTIPRGVDTGSRVRLKGKGGDGRDLVLVIRVPAHRVFTRSGADISRELPITLGEALLGAEVPVPTLDGRVLLRIPAGTQNGRTIRLKGKGMPVLRKDERGDMLARVRVVLPTALTDEAKDAAERFLDLVHQPDPRAV